MFVVDSPFVVCCFVPLLLCFAAVSHQPEGADPSSNEAYPRVIAPAPRPGEGPGSAIVRGRLDTAFRDIFFASLCLAEGHRDPQNHFWRGGGVYCPLRSLFHTHVCFSPAPGFSFFLSLSVSLSLSLSLCLFFLLALGAPNWIA